VGVQDDIDVSELPSKLGVGIALTTDPQMTRGLLEQLCIALSGATGLEVEPRGVSSYPQLLEQLAAKEVDIVWLPPIPALRATAQGRVVPIALPVRAGESSYRATLFTRAYGDLRDIDDLVGARAAWVDPQSAAGHLIICAYLKAEGLDLGRAFGENLFVGSHDAVAAAVREGRADVGATYAYFDEAGGIKRAGWGSDEVHVIAQVGPIPNDIVAARHGLSSVVLERVQRALVEGKSPELREAARVLLAAEGFAHPTEEHLGPLRLLLAGLQEASDQAHSMYPPSL
jgi:phosphonate transport system substrate-binding protein